MFKTFVQESALCSIACQARASDVHPAKHRQRTPRCKLPLPTPPPTNLVPRPTRFRRRRVHNESPSRSATPSRDIDGACSRGPEGQEQLRGEDQQDQQPPSPGTQRHWSRHGSMVGDALKPTKLQEVSPAVQLEAPPQANPREERIERAMKRLLGTTHPKQFAKIGSGGTITAGAGSTSEKQDSAICSTNVDSSLSVVATTTDIAPPVLAASLDGRGLDTFGESEMFTTSAFVDTAGRPPPSSPSANRKHRAVGDVDPLRLEIESCHKRMAINKKLQSRIRAFDRRWVVPEIEEKVPEEERRLSTSIFRDVMSLIRPRGERDRKANPDMAMISELGPPTEESTYELAFAVVDCSSQHSDYPASSLEKGRGRWETTPSDVKNVFVTCELDSGPGTVIGVEFGICDVLATPRRCRVQYCEKSSKGPWLDAWKFAVDSPGGRLTFRSEFQYGQNVRQFTDAILKYCGDEAAAAKFLDVNGTGSISRDELLQLCRQLQQMRGNALAASVAACNLNMLFQELDAEASGILRVKDLLSGEAKPPVAQYWRVLMVDNWGAANNIAVGSPMKLISPEIQTRRVGLSLPGRHRQSSIMVDHLINEQEEPPSHAQDNQKLRHLAFEHNMRYSEVVAVHSLFQRIDTDGSGSICRIEFEQLIIQLYGLSDAADLPASRVQHFWRQADKDGSGSIDFSEFLSWHHIMANPPPRSAPYVEMAGKTLITAIKRSNAMSRTTEISPKSAEMEGGMLGSKKGFSSILED
mmetsp:Transcript_31768/g.80303  ORF Transcript_31768/g.80303 Transcript_31768/m.80303 type:complete len:753 (+) Transcript_31768:33-2291(+)